MDAKFEFFLIHTNHYYTRRILLNKIMEEDAYVRITREEIVPSMPVANQNGNASENGSDSDHGSEHGSNIDSEVDNESPMTEGRFIAAREAYLAACANFLSGRDANEHKLEVTQQDIEMKRTPDNQAYQAWNLKPAAWAVAEEGKLDLNDDPRIIIEVNNTHRRSDVPDGPNSDLWSVKQLHSSIPRIYKFNTPIVVPAGWNASNVIPDQDAYTSNFNDEFPEISRILPMANVAVCGGAAAWPLGNLRKKPSDIDFFLYGLPADDSEASRRIRWNCVGALAERIRNEFYNCIEMLSPGVVTIKGFRRYTHGTEQLPPVKMQIILRAYPTVSSILHGFDIPSCCVAYDGHIAVMTTLAAFAHTFRANIVVPEYRSTTYESRLIKYFERGYALVMPHLNVAAITVGTPISLPWITITPTKVAGRVISGSICLVEKQPCSDYFIGEPRNGSRHREIGAASHGQDYINLKMLASDRPFIKIKPMEIADRYVRQRRRASPMYDDTGITFETLWDEPTKSAVFPRESLVTTMRKTVGGLVSPTGLINTTRLKYIFALNPEQILKLTEAVSDLLSTESRGSHIDISPAMEPFCNALLAKWDARPDVIQWWILHDPARQYTSSLNPRMEDPRSWYESAYIDTIHPITRSETLEAMIGVYEARAVAKAAGHGDAFDGTCAICCEEIHSGDRNSVTLMCGHVFHVTPTASCGAFCTWATGGNRSCPTCRADFGEQIDKSGDSSAIVLSIAL